MIKVDLITGFLGAGKTTFLKQYVQRFLDRGQKIGILENDYGAINVDMLLLNELRSDQCELEMVAGGCDADCHRRRFKTKLISMGMSGYDRVVIEPSGIFDMDEFFDALREEPLDNWYEIGNVITVVDAGLGVLSEDSGYYLISQIANAGCVVFSKVQLTNADRLSETEEYIRNEAQSTGVTLSEELYVCRQSWETMSDEDWKRITDCGYHLSSYVKQNAARENDYSTLYFLEQEMNEEFLQTCVTELMENEKYGHVLRIKGFFRDQETWKEINATRKEMSIRTIPVGQQVLIVIGEKLKEDAIRARVEQRS